MKNKTISSLLLVCASLACVNLAYADEAISPIPQVADEWRASVSPYGWLPAINTTRNNGGPGSKIADISMNQVLSNLKSGAMIAGDVHYGKWGVMADFATATLQQSNGFNFRGDPKYRIVDKGTVQATLFNFVGTYNVLSNQDVYMDALAGVRWVGMTTTINLALNADPSIKLGASDPIKATYGIVGLNSRYRIMGSNWYIPFYADVGTGTGTNSATWQASTGVGVALSKMVDVSLTYRALGFEIKSGNDNTTLIKGLFHGPQLMGTFNF